MLFVPLGEAFFLCPPPPPQHRQRQHFAQCNRIKGKDIRLGLVRSCCTRTHRFFPRMTLKENFGKCRASHGPMRAHLPLRQTQNNHFHKSLIEPKKRKTKTKQKQHKSMRPWGELAAVHKSACEVQSKDTTTEKFTI